MKASRIISQARILLKDPAGVRWPDAELIGWLNGAQLQVAAVRPDSSSKKLELTLVAGVEQVLPEGGTKLLDVIRNVGETSSRAITLSQRAQLNEFNPDWYEADPVGFLKHYLYDENAPKDFEVYPPAEAGYKVLALIGVIPDDCENLESDIALDAIYEGPLIDWVCYRAWLKNIDSEADQGKAAASLQTFMQALTGKTQTDGATRPARK